MERSDFHWVKEISRVETFIAHKPIGGPVKIIGPRFQDGVDDSAGGPPVLGRIVRRQDGKLLDRVHAQLRSLHAARRAIGIVVYGNSVDAIIILSGAMADYGQLIPKAAIAPVYRAGSTQLSADADHSRLENGQGRPAADVHPLSAHGALPGKVGA